MVGDFVSDGNVLYVKFALMVHAWREITIRNAVTIIVTKRKRNSVVMKAVVFVSPMVVNVLTENVIHARRIPIVQLSIVSQLLALNMNVRRIFAN